MKKSIVLLENDEYILIQWKGLLGITSLKENIFKTEEEKREFINEMGYCILWTRFY